MSLGAARRPVVHALFTTAAGDDGQGERLALRPDELTDAEAAQLHDALASLRRAALAAEPRPCAFFPTLIGRRRHVVLAMPLDDAGTDHAGRPAVAVHVLATEVADGDPAHHAPALLALARDCRARRSADVGIIETVRTTAAQVTEVEVDAPSVAALSRVDPELVRLFLRAARAASARGEGCARLDVGVRPGHSPAETLALLTGLLPPRLRLATPWAAGAWSPDVRVAALDEAMGGMEDAPEASDEADAYAAWLDATRRPEHEHDWRELLQDWEVRSWGELVRWTARRQDDSRTRRARGVRQENAPEMTTPKQPEDHASPPRTHPPTPASSPASLGQPPPQAGPETAVSVEELNRQLREGYERLRKHLDAQLAHAAPPPAVAGGSRGRRRWLDHRADVYFVLTLVLLLALWMKVGRDAPATGTQGEAERPAPAAGGSATPGVGPPSEAERARAEPGGRPPEPEASRAAPVPGDTAVAPPPERSDETRSTATTATAAAATGASERWADLLVGAPERVGAVLRALADGEDLADDQISGAQQRRFRGFSERLEAGESLTPNEASLTRTALFEYALARWEATSDGAGTARIDLLPEHEAGLLARYISFLPRALSVPERASPTNADLQAVIVLDAFFRDGA